MWVCSVSCLSQTTHFQFVIKLVEVIIEYFDSCPCEFERITLSSAIFWNYKMYRTKLITLAIYFVALANYGHTQQIVREISVERLENSTQRFTRNNPPASRVRNPLEYNRSLSCIGAADSSENISTISCSDIGNPNFSNLITTYSATSGGSPGTVNPVPSCWDGTQNTVSWSQFELSPNTENLYVNLSYAYDDIVIDQNTYLFLTFFQGPDCNNLTELDCVDLFQSAASFIIENLDDSQPLWILSSSDDEFIIDSIQLSGFSAFADNNSCSTAGQDNNGCNVGAYGDASWTGPCDNGIPCQQTDCTQTLTLVDLFNNGWANQASVSVYIDGVLQTTLSLGPGQSPLNYTFDHNCGVVDIVYTPGSPPSQDWQNGIQITNGFGTETLKPFSFFIPTGSLVNPGSIAGMCTQAWYSNENTVYYTFTATQTNGSIQIENALCNNGSTGELQLGVWESCADVGSYGNGYLGCSVGTGELNISSLVPGETYVIAVDGQGGDMCTWDFVTDGIILPVELIYLNAEQFENYNKIYWATASEYNADYFSIERSVDGSLFQEIGKVTAAGTSSEVQFYEFDDIDPRKQTVFYRIKQFDFDGKYEYYGPKVLYYNLEEAFVITPNPSSTSKPWLNYDFRLDLNYEILLGDNFGRVMRKNIYTGNQITSKGIELNTSGLSSGMYVVTILENGQNIGSKKIIIH